MKKVRVYQIWEGKSNEKECVTDGWVVDNIEELLPEHLLDQVKILKRDEDSNPVLGEVDLDRDTLIEFAAIHYGKFLSTLGFDWENDSHMKDTPTRVAKAWIDDLAKSCFHPEPKITSFKNDENYHGIVLQRGIEVKSMCAHHNLPFVGIAHVAYIPQDNIIGLSKLNRIVDYQSRKPTVQESLTQSIHDYVNNVCKGNKGVAVVVKASHMCVSCRGIGQESNMVTSVLTGDFYSDSKTREEFFKLIEF